MTCYTTCNLHIARLTAHAQELRALRIPQQLRTWTDTRSQGRAVPPGIEWWHINGRSEIHKF